MYTAGELAGLHFVTQSERGLEDAGRGSEDIVLCSIDFQKAAARRGPKRCFGGKHTERVQHALQTLFDNACALATARCAAPELAAQEVGAPAFRGGAVRAVFAEHIQDQHARRTESPY